MTKIYRHSLWIIIAAAFFTVAQVGCAGTSTRESTGEYVDDTAITAKVKAALGNDTLVSAFDVHVETYKGTVSLSGFVDTKQQKARAESVAKDVAGVQKVENNLTVKS